MSAAWALLRRQGVKKAPSSRVRSIWDEPSKTKAFTYTAHCVWNTPRYHFVCCTGSRSQRTYIRSPVTWAKRPYITADGVGVRFTQAARRGERFAPDYRRCIRWAALWERVLQRIMSCSSHLPNDCPYFSAEFTNCQYLWHKFGGCTNSEKRSAKFLGDFCSCVKRKKLYTSTNEKSSRSGLDFHTLMC